MKKTTLLCCLLLSTFVLAWSQEELQDPIDRTLQACLDYGDDQSTYGMRTCIQNATEAWDEQLNLVYQNLMNELSKNNKAKLRNSQRKWIAFRDAEFDFINDGLYPEDGTMYYIMRDHDRMEIIKQRVLILREYLRTLEEFGN